MSTANIFPSMRPNFKESQTKKMQNELKGQMPKTEASPKPVRFHLLHNLMNKSVLK